MSASTGLSPCPRERELLALLRSGRWPATAATDDELRAHLAGCEGCQDLLEVASALLEDRDGLVERAEMPGSGLVWWRLQMRRRHEAARAARRTLLLVQVVCVTVAGGAALAMLQTLVPGWGAATLAALRPSLSALAWIAGLLGLIAGAGLASRAAARRRASSSPS